MRTVETFLPGIVLEPFPSVPCAYVYESDVDTVYLLLNGDVLLVGNNPPLVKRLRLKTR